MEIFVLSNRWFILSVIFLARISMGYQFRSIGSVSPSLIKEFAIEYAAIGIIEHCVLSTPKATKWMKDLGVVIGVTPAFIRHGGDI